MAFNGIVVGKLKSDPQIETEEYEYKGETRERTMALIRVSTGRYDVKQRKRILDGFVLTLSGKQAQKVIDKGYRKDDEIFAFVILQPTVENTVFYVKQIGRLGEEGLNLHVLIGAVENVDMDYVGAESIEKTTASIRIPTESFTDPGKIVNSFVRTQSWRKTAETINSYLSAEEEEQNRKWAMFLGSTVNRRAEIDGETKWFFTCTVDQIEFTNTKTKKHVSEAEDSGIETGASGGFTPDPDDDEDIPF